MTIVDSLKRLAKTITGKDLTGETVAEVVDGLNDNYPEGGGGSVTVDSALSEMSENPVQNKAIYARLAELEAAIEAAKNDYVVTFTVSMSGDTPTISTETSVSEILAAKASGRNVVGIADLGAYEQEFPLTAYGPGLNNEGLVAFGAVLPDSGEQKTSVFAVQGDVMVDGDAKTDRWQLFVG